MDIKFSNKMYHMWPGRRELKDSLQFRPTLLLQRTGDDQISANVCSHSQDTLIAEFWLELFDKWRNVADECLMKWNLCDIYKQDVVERMTWQPGWNIKIYWIPLVASWVIFEGEVYRFRGYNKIAIDLDNNILTDRVATTKRLATEEEMSANIMAVAIVKAMEQRKFTRHKQSNRGDFLAMHLPRDRKGFISDELETHMAMIMQAYLTTHPRTRRDTKL